MQIKHKNHRRVGSVYLFQRQLKSVRVWILGFHVIFCGRNNNCILAINCNSNRCHFLQQISSVNSKVYSTDSSGLGDFEIAKKHNKFFVYIRVCWRVAKRNLLNSVYSISNFLWIWTNITNQPWKNDLQVKIELNQKSPRSWFKRINHQIMKESTCIVKL